MIAKSNFRYACCAAILLLFPLPLSIGGPFQPPGSELDDDPQAADRAELAATLFSDRKTSQAANAFREELERENYEVALVELGKMQVADPQLLVPMANGTWGPLFLNVLADFQLLPNSIRQTMVQESSGVARNRLAALLAGRQLQNFPEFWLKFPGAKESVQALFLMSRIQIDRGQHRAAEFWLKQILNSGDPEAVRIAQQQLTRLEHVVGSEVIEEKKTKKKLGAAVLPQYADWSFRPSLSPVLKDQINAFRRVANRDSVTVTSTWDPGFDRERAYLRTLRGVVGIQLKTGEASWHYPIAPPTEKLLQHGRQLTTFQPFLNGPESEGSFARLDSSLLATVFCRDEVQTRPVVSGGRVFVVATDVNSNGPAPSPTRLFGGPISNSPAFRPGQLIALDAESGRRIWTVGRATLEQHLGPGDIGVWFYGPPCLTKHSVVSVFEWKGEIRIGRFAIDTGKYLSSTPVSLPEQSIDKDVVRTSWASTPIRDGGILWSTTSTGWLLCLDESTMSVLWASRLADESSLRSTTSVRRGRAAALTGQKPLNQRWNRSLMSLSGERMLVLSQESYDAILIDSQTGHRVKTLIQPGSSLLYSDDQQFVLANVAAIRCFSMQDGEKLWDTAAQPGDRSKALPDGVRPTGRGICRDNQLLLPLSDGHLATVDLQSGKLARGDALLLPPNGWGHLEETPDGSLFYVAADQLTRLSQSPSNTPSIEHLSFGLELLAAGKAEEALQEARLITKSDRDYRAARKLEFDCLLQLARSNPQEYLDALREVASSEMQNAQLNVLESQLRISNGQRVEAIALICSLLRKPASVIHVPVASVVVKGTPVGKVQFPDGRMQTDKTELTIHTWAVSALSQLLSEVPLKRWPADDLKAIPSGLLLGIDTPDAAPLVLDKVLQSPSRQLSFELFRHGVELSHSAGKATADDYRDEINVLNRYLKEVLSEDEAVTDVPLDVKRRLLGVALAELPQPFVAAVKSAGIYNSWELPWPEQLFDQLYRTSEEWNSKWDREKWDVLPVRARYTRNDFGRVGVADQKDSFLNRYDWALKYGPSGRFYCAPSFEDGQSAWNVTLSESISHSQSRKEWVYRSGTVVLLNSHHRLTAISVLEGAVLWSIPIQGQVGYTYYHSFKDFNLRTVAPPGSQRPPGWRLLTTDQGCLSMQGRDQVEVRALLTGDLLWKVAQSAVSAPVVAGPDGTLLFSGDGRKGRLLDVKTGQSQSTDLNALSQSGVMYHTDSEVVVWRQGGASPREIAWVNPRNGEVTQSVSLANFTFLQFVDSAVLAAINEMGDLWLIELKTGQIRKYRIPFDGEKFPELVTERFVLANERFLYVVFPSATANVRRRSPHLRAMVIKKDLFVLDRQTGELVSTLTTDDEALMLFEDSKFPLLLIGSQPNQESNRGPLVIRSYDARGKRKQFEASFPLNYGIRNLDYRINQMGSIDLMLDGASFRIEAVKQESTVGAEE